MACLDGVKREVGVRNKDKTHADFSRDHGGLEA